MKWLKKELSSDQVRDIASRFSLDTLTASILARRGITSPEELLFFIEDDPRYLHNPFLFQGMEDAVDRIMAAADEGEKVLVFGDRDVDGITSTVLVHDALKGLGIDVTAKIPKGDEPYGLTEVAIRDFAAAYGTLIVTVDCGVSNRREIALAATLGIDVIVVDHHLPPDAPPDAVAIVNPKLDDSGYPFRDLAGVGVAYKLVRALAFARTELYKQEVCLLNVRPINEAYVVEALKLSNMMEKGRLTETFVPGMVDLTRTRLVKFLEGQQILAYDAPLQKRLLQKALGTGAEINMLDVRDEIAREIPQVRGLSLLKLRELSKLAKYRDGETGEIDVFANLFVSFVIKKTACLRNDDAEALQLVALGTIADIMPLADENRILVRRGLDSLNAKPRPGLKELLVRKELSGRVATSQDVAWQITPLINAAGRMGSPETALALLLEENPVSRGALADSIVTMNEERKRLGQEGWDSVRKAGEESFERMAEKLVIVGGDGIHRGITGILAAKFVNYLDVPACVASFQEDGSARGSVRSVRGFNAKAFLDVFGEWFDDYGGHLGAAGFSIRRAKWDDFLTAVASWAPSVELGGTETETVNIDAELPHDYLTPELIAISERFEPYGEGNPQLVFCARGVRVAQLDLMGKPEPIHVKMLLDCGKYKWPAVYWKASERVKRDFNLGDKVDIVFKMGKNSFSGTVTPQLVILDLERSG